MAASDGTALARTGDRVRDLRTLVDLVLDDSPPEPIAGHLRGVQTEVIAAQDCVRQISGSTDHGSGLGDEWGY